MPRSCVHLAVVSLFIVLPACRDVTPSFQSAEAEPEAYYRPEEDLGALFEAVQLGGVFADSKTFVDARPLISADTIAARYLDGRDTADFDLQAFVSAHFTEPESVPEPPASSDTLSMEAHIERLWTLLTREAPDTTAPSTLVSLPEPYIVPGGRYREVYYWDTFFTMLGLVESGRLDLVEGMIDNFAHLIAMFGFVPNGNRTYFLTRSQPPFFSQMVMLLAAQTDTVRVAEQYVEVLIQEHAFWMDGFDALDEAASSVRRVVRLEDGTTLNRYWDSGRTPRPEFYRDDFELGEEVAADERPRLWQDLRSESESGWGLSSRWQRQPGVAASTHMSDILPVDLNSLLYAHERALSDLLAALGRDDEARQYAARAQDRAEAIRRVHWDDGRGAFFDYDAGSGGRKNVLTLATMFPLYFGIATEAQARRTADVVGDSLLAPGGFVTSTLVTGGPWDAPNGWAPLQWVTVRGLERYGYDALARTGRDRWLALNRSVYQNTGKMLERYNVVDLSLRSGGGEYPFRDGFGWTNGVALAFLGRPDGAAGAPQ